MMSKIRQLPVRTGFRRLAGGEVVAPHRHDEHHLVYASTGVLSISTDDGIWVAPSNRVLWIPAHTVHTHRAYGTSTLLTVAVPATGPRKFGTATSAAHSTISLEATPLIRALLHGLGDDAGGDSAAFRRMRAVLLDQVSAQLRDTDSGGTGRRGLHIPSAADPRLRAAARLLDAQPQLSLSEVAQRLAIGTRTLSRLCRDRLGMTFPQWRTQIRLHRALVMLATETHAAATPDVTRVAAASGWSSPSAFIDAFRRQLGYTPGSVRRDIRAGAR